MNGKKKNPSIRLCSFAKINLALEILGQRSDGYHELRTIFQTVDLRDFIDIEEAESDIEIRGNHPDMPLDERNLAFQAAQKLLSLIGTKKGLRIRIEKNIPIAAGLGGGSSNAAAVLLGLNKLWQLGIEDEELLNIASSLGADVPYFLLGGTVLGLGRGDELFALKEVAADHMIIACPARKISSAEAYKKWNLKLTKNKNDNIIIRRFSFFKGNLSNIQKNDFEDVILKEVPLIGEIKAQMKKLGSRYCLMSGSGPAVFGIFPDSASASKAFHQLQKGGYSLFRSRTISSEEYKRLMFEFT